MKQMKKLNMLTLTFIPLASAGCGGLLGNHEAPFTYTDIPGVPSVVNDLGREIGQKERDVVRPGGDVDDPGFSDVDQQNFDKSGRLQQIVTAVMKSSTFQNGVTAIEALPSDTQSLIWTTYMKPIDPTWADTGQIGNGTTDAGEAVEEEIAQALTQAVQTAVGSVSSQSKAAK